MAKAPKKLPSGIRYRNGSYRAEKMILGHRFGETFDTLEEAKNYLADLQIAKRDGTLFVEENDLNSMTVGDLVARYRDECMQHRDADRKGHIPAILNDTVSNIQLKDLAYKDVRSFRDRQLKQKKSPKPDSPTLAPSTVVKRLNMLASIFQYAIREWDVPIENYASANVVKRPPGADKKRTSRLKVTSSVNEEDVLIDAIQRSNFPDDAFLVKWSIEQATRLSEALSLTWGDVDFERKTISLERVKNDKHREELGPELRPLTPGARRLLEHRLTILDGTPDPKEHIFQVGTKDAVSARFRRVVSGTDIENFRFHDLRHEATSRLSKFLTNPLDLMRVTGHRDLKSLDRYYQPVLAELANKIEEQERLIGRVNAVLK